MLLGDRSLRFWGCALQVGKDGTRSGWLSDNGASLAADVGAVDWRVADCGPGDIVVLGEAAQHPTGMPRLANTTAYGTEFYPTAHSQHEAHIASTCEPATRVLGMVSRRSGCAAYERVQ